MPGFKKTFLSGVSLKNVPFYIRYGVPVLLTLVATLTKITLADYIGYKTPFLLYLGIVIITAKRFGAKPAIVVSLLSAVIVNLLFMHPPDYFPITREAILQTIGFLLECTLVIGLSSALTDAVSQIDENDARFKTLVEKSSEGIVTMNVDGKIIYSSPSVQNIIGYTDEEFIHLPTWQLLHEDEASKVREQFFRFASHPNKTLTIIHRMKHKNGNWIWIESKMTNLLDERPINAVIANFTEVTERVLNEKLKEDFIGIASHELKTPLTSLKAYTQVLQHRFKNSEDETSLNIINKIEHQVTRVVQMITNLLDVTTLQEKKLNLHIRDIDLNLLVTEIADAIQQTTKVHRIILQLAPLPTIPADRERLAQVISNMISNAIKYSPNADAVQVSTRIENDRVIFSVLDHGIGISPSELNQVFERFFRADGAKKSFQGLGLGLFICAQILEQHGGEIGATSKEGEGSTFWFSLPLA
ncbi:PAS domain-containing sensor histidine kinase [Mucilaginibacter paludis]|uniref:histidine kinase n=1 Tax=Mucilaginibacter paludis DSM 18603 TaxID=714943 RepID=H1Y0C7_9SPHI|nr:ATP-binding protein [Mucilaginibacter paludis]EHQ28176.1 multi-sensor signal transduction histidine kinase [Mucilaginibacter paludis DSM 18603]